MQTNKHTYIHTYIYIYIYTYIYLYAICIYIHVNLLNNNNNNNNNNNTNNIDLTKCECVTFPLKLWCMEVIPRVLGFVAQGASTNWWGLACPSHCFAAGPFVVLSAFALGITCGLFLAVFLAWTFLRPFSVDSAPQSSTSAAWDRVRAYVHEPKPSHQLSRRRGRG